MSKSILISTAIGVVLLVSAAIIFWPKVAQQPQGDITNESVSSSVSSPQALFTKAPANNYKTISSNDISGINAIYAFTVKIPSSWQAEAVKAADAVNIYDPRAAGANNLEKSQIFIRYFSADDFLTLTTVDIHDRKSLTINNRPAVQYDIEKKPRVADFPNQPAWRSKRHIVTDIRSTDKSPAIFYVIAKAPTLRDSAYEDFLNGISFTATKTATENEKLIEPITEFKSRISKKPFGILIDPKTSSVQPEKFSGYHTGADIEYDDIAEDTPVYAIADGNVLVSRTASGYGGVVAIRHTVQDKTVVAIYGHLNPNSLVPVGSEVKAGQQIGILGKHHSSETDGERKHLHFGIVNASETDLRGYVQAEAELSHWINPVSLYN